MLSNLSTIYLPVRSSPSESINNISKLEVVNAQGVEESCIDLGEMRARARQESTLVWAGIVSDNVDKITHFEITVASGESVFLKCKGVDSFEDCKFHVTAIRHRDVKIFLVDDYTDKRVIEASRIVDQHGQGKIFVLADELPDYAERLRSFHPLLPNIQGADVQDSITRLASKGFYLKEGVVRCNGCDYRKPQEEFIKKMHSPRGYLASMKSMLPAIFGKSDAFDHEDDNCYLATTENKTFLRVSHASDSKVAGGFRNWGTILFVRMMALITLST